MKPEPPVSSDPRYAEPSPLPAGVTYSPVSRAGSSYVPRPLKPEK
jgi:hypothetical protein